MKSAEMSDKEGATTAKRPRKDSRESLEQLGATDQSPAQRSLATTVNPSSCSTAAADMSPAGLIKYFNQSKYGSIKVKFRFTN